VAKKFRVKGNCKDKRQAQGGAECYLRIWRKEIKIKVCVEPTIGKGKKQIFF
jgi:hypothetical protein